MKKLYLSCVFAVAMLCTAAQTQFANKQEALTWLQQAFAKYFVKSKVNPVKVPDAFKFEDLLFDYSFSDSYLLIKSGREDGLTGKSFRFILIPYDKISNIMVGTTEFYRQATHIIFQSDCRCFKRTDGKKFKGEGYADDLLTLEIIPFNINDEKDIGASLKNAFAVLSGRPAQQTSVESKTASPAPSINVASVRKVTSAEIQAAKNLYQDLSLPGQKTDWELAALHGKIRSDKETFTTMKKDESGKEVPQSGSSTFYMYSTEGRLLYTESAFASGSKTSTFNIYNNKGLLLYTIRSEDSTYSVKCSYEKVKEGVYLQKRTYDFSGALYTYIFSNDDLVSAVEMDDKGLVKSESKYENKYDKNKKLISQDKYVAGVLNTSMKNMYNSKNLLIGQEYSKNGSVSSRRDFKYNDKNNIVEVNAMEGNSLMTIKHTNFDEKSNSIRYEVYENGNLTTVVSKEISYY